jgi:spermidine synthase
MNKVKQFLSYLYPVLIESRSGELSDCLEVRKRKGKYVLDSHTVNYSYGGLHQLFDSLFHITHIKEQSFNSVLLLGMGAGSVVSLLTERYEKICEVTAIENDAIVIELAKKYFAIQRFDTLRIIKEDALKFVGETKNKYDLIIVDLFIDNEVPEMFTTQSFINNLRKIATNNCSVIFNKTTETLIHKKEFDALYKEFEHYFPGSTVIKLVANGMENSFIYYSTLPLVIKEKEVLKEKNDLSQDTWPGFEPAYNLDKMRGKLIPVFSIKEFGIND